VVDPLSVLEEEVEPLVLPEEDDKF